MILSANPYQANQIQGMYCIRSGRVSCLKFLRVIAVSANKHIYAVFKIDQHFLRSHCIMPRWITSACTKSAQRCASWLTNNLNF